MGQSLYVQKEAIAVSNWLCGLHAGLKHQSAQQHAWQLTFSEPGPTSGDSTVYALLVLLCEYDQALWPVLAAQLLEPVAK